MEPTLIDCINAYVYIKTNSQEDIEKVASKQLAHNIVQHEMMHKHAELEKSAVAGTDVLSPAVDFLAKYAPLTAFSVPFAGGALWWATNHPRYKNEAIHKRRMKKIEDDIYEARRQSGLQL